tara:strand:- start:1469 stop:2809 length:1341 start_codon:yes stop_codon:yes gene_type:complete
MPKYIAKLLKLGFTKAKAMQMAKKLYHLPTTVQNNILNRVLFPKLAKTLSPLKKEFTEGYKASRNTKPFSYASNIEKKATRKFLRDNGIPEKDMIDELKNDQIQKAFTGYVNVSRKNLKKQLLTQESFNKFSRNIKEGYRKEMKFFDNNFANLGNFYSKGNTSLEIVGKMDKSLLKQNKKFLSEIWANHYARNVPGGLQIDKWEKMNDLWRINPVKAREFVRKDMFAPYLNKLKDPVKLRKLYNTTVNSSVDNTKVKFMKTGDDAVAFWRPQHPRAGHSAAERLHFEKNPTGWVGIDPSKVAKGTWTTLPHELKHGVQGDFSFRHFPSVMNNNSSIYDAPLARGANSLLKKANINVRKEWKDFHYGWNTKGSEKSAVLSEYRSFNPKGQSLISNKTLPISRSIAELKFHGHTMFGGLKQLKAADKIVFGAVPPGLLGVSVKEDKRG